MKPLPSNTQTLILLWAQGPYIPNEALTQVVANAIHNDASFDPNEVLDTGRLPLQEVFPDKHHGGHRFFDANAEAAHWPLKGDPSWNGQGEYERNAPVAAALLARGANPFETTKSDNQSAWQKAQKNRSQSVCLAMLRHPDASKLNIREEIGIACQNRTNITLKGLLATPGFHFEPDDGIIFDADIPEILDTLIQNGAPFQDIRRNNKTLSEYWVARNWTIEKRKPFEALLAKATEKTGNIQELLNGNAIQAALQCRTIDFKRALAEGAQINDIWAYALIGVARKIWPQHKPKDGVAKHILKENGRAMSEQEQAGWTLLKKAMRVERKRAEQWLRNFAKDKKTNTDTWKVLPNLIDEKVTPVEARDSTQAISLFSSWLHYGLNKREGLNIILEMFSQGEMKPAFFFDVIGAFPPEKISDAAEQFGFFRQH